MYNLVNYSRLIIDSYTKYCQAFNTYGCHLILPQIRPEQKQVAITDDEKAFFYYSESNSPLDLVALKT